jgi:hypothetical protein
MPTALKRHSRGGFPILEVALQEIASMKTSRLGSRAEAALYADQKHAAAQNERKIRIR